MTIIFYLYPMLISQDIMKTRRLCLVPLLLVLLSATGCTGPDAPAEPANEICFHVNMPVAAGGGAVTRADGTTLRYVARLYRGDSANPDCLVERKEELAVNSSEIVFSGEPGQYTITLFADYIPADAAKNERGFYSDRYFDTNFSHEEVKMATLRDADNSSKTYPLSNINRTDCECFTWQKTFTKGAEAYEEISPLTRAVGKVRFVSNTDISDVGKIRITCFAFHSVYKFSFNSSSTQVDYTAGDGKPSCFEFEPVDAANGELFYFHTFGAMKEHPLKEIAFDVVGKDGTVLQSVSTAGNELMPQANRILTVRGDFAKTPDTQASAEMRFSVEINKDWGE